ncbi:MAG: class I SAM-dependent methyltransferase [Limnohabitans sp.]|nr:class I SAM-dependent methyltransferase [Limnohabitans sp.]
MSDYTNMSGYYDLIMTSGYYDYKKIVDGLLMNGPVHDVLEIGCGTGLILEELAKRQHNITIMGIDLTQAMLDIAQQRLLTFSSVKLEQQNITQMSLNQKFDFSFSYGGVWYFVNDGDQEPFLVSHISDHAANVAGFSKLANHMKDRSKLLLGIQGPHFDYAKPISNGMVYSQKIEPNGHGFIKHYYLDDGDRRLMSQTIDYRTYKFEEACDMLGVHGFEFHKKTPTNQQFLVFQKK